MRILLLLLCLVTLAGCGAGGKLWTVEEKGEAWEAVTSADSAGVAPLTLPAEARAEHESRPTNWETSWPVEGAEEFADGLSDGGIEAAPGATGALRITVDVIEIYNGDGISMFQSNPARMTVRARITNAAGKLVAVLSATDTVGEYRGVGPFKTLCWHFGEDLAGWLRAQR